VRASVDPVTHTALHLPTSSSFMEYVVSKTNAELLESTVKGNIRPEGLNAKLELPSGRLRSCSVFYNQQNMPVAVLYLIAMVGLGGGDAIASKLKKNKSMKTHVFSDKLPRCYRVIFLCHYQESELVGTRDM